MSHREANEPGLVRLGRTVAAGYRSVRGATENHDPGMGAGDLDGRHSEPESSAGISIAPPRTLRALRVQSAMGRGRSRPLIVEAEDGESYVAKLSHTDKTARRLIAEVIAGQIVNVLGLPQPEMVLLEIDPTIDAPDLTPEKREELGVARGPAFGSQMLPDASSLRRHRDFVVDPRLAANIIWFDSLVVNHDRKERNPNILVDGEQAWMIDNDSAMAQHHRWMDRKRQDAYAICPDSGMMWWDPKNHVLLPFAGSVEAAGDELAGKLCRDVIHSIVEQPPEIWFQDGFPSGGRVDPRQMYVEFLVHRLSVRKDFERHADHLRIHGACEER